MPPTLPPECQKLQDQVDEIQQILDDESIPNAPHLPDRVRLLVKKIPGHDMPEILDKLRQIIDDHSHNDELADDN